jgi:hypothetical protein
MEAYLQESSDEQTGIKHHIFLIILATTLQFDIVTANDSSVVARVRY